MFILFCFGSGVIVVSVLFSYSTCTGVIEVSFSLKLILNKHEMKKKGGEWLRQKKSTNRGLENVNDEKKGVVMLCEWGYGKREK